MASTLIARIKDRISDPQKATDGADAITPAIGEPARSEEIDAAEAVFGFQLPAMLRQLYLEVGNGGYGPGYGLLGVPTLATQAARQRFVDNFRRNMQRPREDPNWWPSELTPRGEFDIVESYSRYARSIPDDPSWVWPSLLLPVCHLGSAMYECVDCSTTDGAVFWFEPNPREFGDPLDDFIIPLATSLTLRWEAWLSGEDLMEGAYERSNLKRRLDSK